MRRRSAAEVGYPCPNGCVVGYGREERPVVVQYSYVESGWTDGEKSCPFCWEYLGNDGEHQVGRA